jgi:hypothetical protein
MSVCVDPAVGVADVHDDGGIRAVLPPGDWILVTDATYSDDTGWVLATTSEVFVYGISAGLAGTADDFTDTFTAEAQ